MRGCGAAVLKGPLRTFVVVPQALIAEALHTLFDQHHQICMVGNAPLVVLDDLRRVRPDLLIYGLDCVSHDVRPALELARSVDPHMRFCVLSSVPNVEMMRRSLDAGADGFLVTDASPLELDRAIDVLASGAPYIDPRLETGRARRAFVANEVHGGIAELTPREMEILRLIVAGFSNKEISLKLLIVEKTVKNHIGRIFSKLGVTTRTQAAINAMKAGFG